MAASFLAPILNDPNQPWVLRNLRNQRMVATHLEPAFDSATRRKGLLGRAGLVTGAALLIAPSSGIHTFFMQFPIDVIFVKKDGTVLRVVERLDPWRVSLSPRAYAVVEMAAGTARHGETRPGDRLQLERA